MVRDTKTLNKPTERTRDIPVSLKELRAQRRSSVYGNTTVANSDVTREIIARVDADFQRIFGSE
ncbi:MAG TPA: hypothetical protein VH684_19325 [Xanthobacteraceae bacterium]